MIPVTALPLPPSIPMLGELPVLNPAEGGEGTDFSALLAQNAALTIDPAALAVNPDTVGAAQLQLPAALPGTAMTGKILPPSLPLGEEALPPSTEAAANVPPLPEQASTHAVTVRQLLNSGKDTPANFRPAARKDKDAKELPEQAQAEIVDMLPAIVMPEHSAIEVSALPIASEALAVTPPTALPVAVLAEVTPAKAKPEAEAEAEAKAEPRVNPSTIQPPVIAALRPATLPPQAETVAADTPEPPAKPVPALRPLTQVQIDVGLPEPLSRAIAKDAPAVLPLLPVEAGPIVAFALAPTAPAPQAQPLPLSVNSLTSPHDFAVLIDRLAAAREAAAPQAIAVSLPHAEFGQIQLRFRHEDGALAVSMASSDPDFARIAAQAAPPILPVQPAVDPRQVETGSGQSGPRSEQAASHNPSQQGQQRGNSAESRQSAAAQTNHSHRTAEGDKPGRRHGIFA